MQTIFIRETQQQTEIDHYRFEHRDLVDFFSRSKREGIPFPLHLTTSKIPIVIVHRVK
jgi:hypothetical protein